MTAQPLRRAGVQNSSTDSGLAGPLKGLSKSWRSKSGHGSYADDASHRLIGDEHARFGAAGSSVRLGDKPAEVLVAKFNALQRLLHPFELNR